MTKSTRISLAFRVSSSSQHVTVVYDIYSIAIYTYKQVRSEFSYFGKSVASDLNFEERITRAYLYV